MFILSFFNETLTRIRPGTKESRGSTIADWTNATTATITGCHIQPGGTTQDQDGRELAIIDALTAYVPQDADIQAGDRIIYDGETYSIVGEPRKWKSPTGAVSNKRLTLEKWRG